MRANSHSTLARDDFSPVRDGSLRFGSEVRPSRWALRPDLNDIPKASDPVCAGVPDFTHLLHAISAVSDTHILVPFDFWKSNDYI
jgi:hypothetical protein